MAVKKTKSTKSKATKRKSISASTFGDYLAVIRTDKSFSQVEFAEKLGMSKQNLCDIERGRRNTTPKTAAGLAKKLGVAPGKLVKLVLQDLVHRDGLRFKIDVK